MNITARPMSVALLSVLTGCSTLQGAPDTSVLSRAAVTSIQQLDLHGAGALTRLDLAKAVSKIPAAAPRAAAAAAATTTSNDLDDAYNKMMGYCRATLTRFEGRANAMAYWSAAIAVIGSLAGGVAIPALAVRGNKAWTAALGGVSGATNAGQQSLNSAGLSAAAELQSRQDVLTSWKADIAPYYDPKSTLDEQTKSVAKSLADCELYEISTSGASH